jgi:DNA-binding XRE family transcriptional regulator
METKQPENGFDIRRLKFYREKAGLSQAALGKKAGIHPIQVSFYETGRIKKPHPKTAAKLEAALSACFREGLPPATPTENRPAGSIRIVCPHCGGSSYSLADIPGIEYKCISCSRGFKVDARGRGHEPERATMKKTGTASHWQNRKREVFAGRKWPKNGATP